MKPIRLRVHSTDSTTTSLADQLSVVLRFYVGASLMMAMYFEGRLRLTKELEMDIWREGSMVEIFDSMQMVGSNSTRVEFDY